MDFIKEFTSRHLEVLRIGGNKLGSPEKLTIWQVYSDGASNCQGMRVGIVLISLKGIRLEKSFRLGFQASNNEAEYDVLLAGL